MVLNYSIVSSLEEIAIKASQWAGSREAGSSRTVKEHNMKASLRKGAKRKKRYRVPSDV